MQSITVKYYNLVREVTGVPSEVCQVPPGTTLGQVLEQLVARHGPDLGRLVLDAAGLSPQVRLFLNGRAVTNDMLPDALPPGAELALFLAISGG
ncbi:MAG: MoaD family protein [Bacillota bacterium]